MTEPGAESSGLHERKGEPMSDLISRQAAIDAICKACSMEEDYHKCDGYPETSTWCDELVALRALPSAQPDHIAEVDKKVSFSCGQENDLISRQDAIDAMTNTLWHYPNECYRNLNEYEFAKGLAELGLKSVSSAQPEHKPYHEEWISALRTLPEIIRCKDCKHWDKTWTNDWAEDYHYCPMIDGVHRSDWFCADAERRAE